MAVMHLLRRHEDARNVAYEQLRTGPRDYLKAACPTSIAANVLIHSARGRILAVRRSGAVDTAAGLWTLGIFETMILDEHRTKGTREDLFTLCERGLREEVGLEPGAHYPQVLISWFGIYGPLLRAHLVVHARATLPESAAPPAPAALSPSFDALGRSWLASR